MSEDRSDQLKIHEIFYSLQGESTLTGLPTVFVRLTGCPLRCVWCDTEYAFGGGQWMHYDDILAEVAQHQTPYVCVTGGEPLAQKRVHGLLDRLMAENYTVSLETAGALSVADVHPDVIKIIDLKAPGSGEMMKNDYTNLDLVSHKDQVKFVIADDKDYQWAVATLHKYAIHERCQVLFSPVADVLPPKQLAEWILADHLPVRMQIQLHKLLWGDTPGT
ncbi:7-carboxy-7-deazaguanine synthase QueE [Marinicella gelatinilytica]|uniref:7-carboxy-7-deazaguanine synthase QueE n=1 Tax=Marinicella gelatinilytica TaxID=2996017 RepID=UPI002260E6B5|nr:7-carboxy-7-deazaguanine synthase QueE [Marinicella gelatinilytica]MCX7545869.1 7-carboxy-7-deazaguanine synthase QueE [Marinicella gelatinilytica]